MITRLGEGTTLQETLPLHPFREGPGFDPFEGPRDMTECSFPLNGYLISAAMTRDGGQVTVARYEGQEGTENTLEVPGMAIVADSVLAERAQCCTGWFDMRQGPSATAEIIPAFAPHLLYAPRLQECDADEYPLTGSRDVLLRIERVTGRRTTQPTTLRSQLRSGYNEESTLVEAHRVVTDPESVTTILTMAAATMGLDVTHTQQYVLRFMDTIRQANTPMGRRATVQRLGNLSVYHR